MAYINFGIKDVELSNQEEIIGLYDQGYVMTRVGKGHMEKVRSVRINLRKFNLSSENRRTLKKFSHIVDKIILPYSNYHWQIHKLGKDFYDTKFGVDTFSANKIKEIFTDTDKSNFNSVLTFTNPLTNTTEGYCISLDLLNEKKVLHYSYPFYNLDLINSSFGIYMMTSSINLLKEKGYDYIYLGSSHTAESKYKLQFEGLEWFNEVTNKWSEDLNELKSRLLN